MLFLNVGGMQLIYLFVEFQIFSVIFICLREIILAFVMKIIRFLKILKILQEL